MSYRDSGAYACVYVPAKKCKDGKRQHVHTVGKVFSKQKIDLVKKTNTHADDSNVLPDYIHFDKKKEEEKKPEKVNSEAIPTDD